MTISHTFVGFSRYFINTAIIISMACAAGCTKQSNTSDKSSNTSVNVAADLPALLATPVAVSFNVLDESGQPVKKARVFIDGVVTTCSDGGVCSFSLASRENRFMNIKAWGFHDEFLVLLAAAPSAVTNLSLPTVFLRVKRTDEVRLLFGGDVGLGRRYFDPAAPDRDITLTTNRTGLIDPADPFTGTKNVVKLFRPYFQDADFSSVNLETVVISDLHSLSTPHPDKPFVFFSLYGSLPALKWLGIDYVGQGNNHVYDFLRLGMIDTLKSVQSAEFPHSGAGENAPDAFSAYRTPLKGIPFAFLAMTSIDGRQYPISISYVAEGMDKGGAADATDDISVVASLKSNPADTIIAQVHGGHEYSFKPSPGVLSRMVLAAKNGADLVVSHHPHTAQGLGKSDGKWLLHSLGNFVFDQDRIETMMGILARIDMRSKATQAIRLLPVYIKGYIPTPAAGDTVNRLFRRLAENSDTGVYIYPYLGQGWVTDDISTLSVQSRNVPISVTLDASGAGIFDLRTTMQSDEFLQSVTPEQQSVTPEQKLVLQTGRDLLWFGDFEDIDSDSSPFDGASAHWDLTGGSKISCARGAYQGSAGLCSGRNSTNKTDSVVALRQRVRVDGDATNTPEKDLTLVGYIQGKNAGDAQFIVRYYSSTASNEFGETPVFTHPSGNYTWQMFAKKIHLPLDTRVQGAIPELDEARAMRIFIHHSPPAQNSGELNVDNLAIVSWQPGVPIDVGAPWQQTRYNTTEFLRVKGPPGKHNLQLNVQRWTPNIPKIPK